MRVTSLLMCALVSLVAGAEEVAWKLDLSERAARRADPNANTLRHAAWVAKGRHAADHDDNVVDGEVDPTVLAPIELVEHTAAVFGLESARQEKFRREWDARGAAQVLGSDYWDQLQVVFADAIAAEREIVRIRKLPQAERQAIMESRRNLQYSDAGECRGRADGLIAARKHWGAETFDRFLYQVVAPGVYFNTSCSSPELLKKPEFWLDEWQWMERGCR